MRLPIRNDAPPTYCEAPPESSVDEDANLPALHLHAVPSRRALIVKVQPPRSPSSAVDHVPCDIVLVIDVSGSMAAAAPIPGENGAEDTGLSVLDLTKHAALTIVETLNEGDRLGIVAFGSKSKVMQTLETMTDSSKEKARENIKALQPQDATNLWHGIRDGINLFKEGASASRVPAIMVLTDGMPNHMCPPAGYIPKLRTMRPLPASIHTFGFGYHLRSGLLKSLAEFGHGNYAFIPDAGMIGTVFVHAVANLQTTFATNANLLLTYPHDLELDETMGDSVVREEPESAGVKDENRKVLRIPLGNLQYGQSRDVFLRLRNVSEKDSVNYDMVSATLEFEKITLQPSMDDAKSSHFPLNFWNNAGKDRGRGRTVSSIRPKPSQAAAVSEEEICYHESRARICSYLSSWFPLGSDGEHRVITSGREEKRKELTRLIEEIPARNHGDVLNKSLMEDLVGAEPKGQISLAINKDEYFNKWGVHFLPSYHNAHARQICNSFKDSGPLQYGVDSPLFNSCRDRLDDAFDHLPAPEPSLTMPAMRGYSATGGSGQCPGSGFVAPKKISMSRYHDASGVCFAASTNVELASGRTVQIRQLKQGMKVRTLAGPRKVAFVLKTAVRGEMLCRAGSVAVTPWHPISVDGTSWTFPAYVATGKLCYTGSVYSIMLQRDGNAKAHSMRLGGCWGVTLGHGLTSGADTRAHAFFGDYNLVGKSLVGLSPDRHGVVAGRGVRRDAGTGLVVGFKGMKLNAAAEGGASAVAPS
ncbi:hypothetical protein RJ55_00096 [Drechmeria coniospora]|nr:hypothetical protein RJ55_00096 [Drechmeria coniospora]